MPQVHHATLLQVRPLCGVGALFCTIVLAGTLLTGCTTQVKTDRSQVAMLQIDADVNDPTAETLHDLAGKLLMYEAVRHRLPATLDELTRPKAGGQDRADSDGRQLQNRGIVDPASNLPFVYTPDSPHPPGLPGRIVVYQPQEQGPAGRWALLWNDLGSHGKVITYVQRVPENLLPKVKDKHPTFRQTLP